MSRYVLLLLSTILLSACGTVMEGATQEVHLETPGANDAICYLDNGHMRYRVFTPGKVLISKRPGDLEVDCVADGNRRQSMTFKQDINDWALANVSNAGLGAAIDYETGGLFHYPEKIVVDFTQIAATTMPTPNYQKHLLENPHLFGMEEFRPGRAALLRDRYDDGNQLKRREFLPGEEAPAPSVSGFTESDGTADTAAVIGSASANATRDNDNAGSSSGSAATLTKTMNPEVFGGSGAGSSSSLSPSDSFVGGTASPGNSGDAPVTLYPVQ